jgi:CDP-2,3-bis-(O-geranylgeranyl)-sn-glycerol synthase
VKLLLAVLWFLVTPGAANMAPVLARHLFPAWDQPLDGGRTFRGRRILGDHKTVRGVVCGMIVAAVVYQAQEIACERWEGVRALVIVEPHGAWFGALLGAGALGGDLVKSFAKRRIGVAPGRPWIPFDQVDWIAGALAVAAPFAHLDLPFVALALLLGPAASALTRWIGWRMRLNPEPL